MVEMSSAATTVLVGLGNPVRGDDGVGLRVAEAVSALLAARPVAGARVVTSTRGGFELMDLLEGADRAIVVDCLDLPDAVPGRVRQLPLRDLAGAARLVGSHDIGLAAAIELGRLLGARMPEHVEVFGIEAWLEDRIEECLSPALEAAVQPLARFLYSSLAARPINQSTNQPINQSISQSTNQQLNRSTND
jgi:hydrogenase maturation protease